MTDIHRSYDNNVIVAEDSDVLRQYMAFLLEEEGFVVHEAENGREAVEIYKKNPCSLVLLDLEMNLMGGEEAAFEIRKFEALKSNGSQKRALIIALTGYTRKACIERVLDAGMDDQITKPVTREDLEEIFREHEFLWPGAERRESEPELCARQAASGLAVDLFKIARVFGDNKELVKRVLEDFLYNSREKCKAILSAIENKQPDIIRFEAHSIHGGARTLEAGDLARVAEKLEYLGRDGKSEPCRPVLLRVVSELDRLEAQKNEVLDLLG